MNRVRLLKGIAQSTLSIVVLLLLARAAAPHWHELQSSLGALRFDPLWGGVAVVFAAAHYRIALELWKRSLLVAGIPLSTREAANTWVPGLLARYIPGKIWSNGIRLAVARRYGSPVFPVTGAMVYESLLAISTACIVALLLLRSWPDPAWRASVVVLLLVTAGAVAFARFLLAGVRRPSRLERLRQRLPPIAGRRVLELAAINLLAWGLYGAMHWALAHAVVALPLTEYPGIAGAVALAWTGGFLAVVMPAGLGIREGLLVLLLAPSLGPGPVVVIAAASRLISIGLDLAITALWAFWRAPQPASGSPPSA